MVVEDLFTVEAVRGSVFLDNLALCSADRLITGNYSAIKDDPIFADSHGGGRDAAAVLISHDLVNTAVLLESLVCFDHIYVNAEYVDRWNKDIGDETLAKLGNLVSAVSLSPGLRREAETVVVVKQIEWRNFDYLAGEEELSSLVHIATHNAWDRYGDTREMKTRILSPYQEASRPFPSDGGILVGAGFYMGCSQALGIPYRPSALRALAYE